MNAWTSTPADASPTDAPSGAGAEPSRHERHLAMLDRLAEAGLNIVLAIERQAMQAADDQSADDQGAEAPGAAPPHSPTFTGDLALAYARAARAVRMSIALQARLIAERQAAAVADATAARMAAVRDRPARRARIERIVERLAGEAHEDDAEAVERCVAEAAERLDDVDVFGDVLDRPVSETIALICRELGLSPDWPALAQEAWAREEVESGAIGRPLLTASTLFHKKPETLSAGKITELQRFDRYLGTMTKFHWSNPRGESDPARVQRETRPPMLSDAEKDRTVRKEKMPGLISEVDSLTLKKRYNVLRRTRAKATKRLAKLNCDAGEHPSAPVAKAIEDIERRDAELAVEMEAVVAEFRRRWPDLA